MEKKTQIEAGNEDDYKAEGMNVFQTLVDDGAKMIEEIVEEIQQYFDQETPGSVELLLKSLRECKKKAEMMLARMQKYMMSNTLVFSQSNASSVDISNWGSLQDDFRRSQKFQGSERTPRATEKAYDKDKETFDQVQAKLKDTIKFIETSEKAIAEKKHNYSLNKNLSIGKSYFFSLNDYVSRQEKEKEGEEMGHYNKYPGGKGERASREKDLGEEAKRTRKRGFFQRLMCYCSNNS